MKMKSKNIKYIMIFLVIVLVVVFGIGFCKKIYENRKTVTIDNESKKFLSVLSSYVEDIDENADINAVKEQISEKTVELQKKYSGGNGVSIGTTDILNSLSSSAQSSTKDLKTELLEKINNLRDVIGGLITKSSVDPIVVTMSSASVCSIYGQDSEYCLDGVNKKLSANIYINDSDSTNWVLLLHGNSMDGKSIYNSLGSMYESNNYNVIAPDFRGQGNSDGAVAMGYLESLDSYDWIKYINNNYKVKNFVIHGVSLGGATTLQLATNPDFANELRNSYHVKGFVDDCGYTSMMNVVKGLISIGDTSSLSAIFANAEVTLSEFKEKVNSIFNGLNMETSIEDINQIFSGNVSLEEFENKLSIEYPFQYEDTKELVEGITEQYCEGNSYEDCLKNAYQQFSDQKLNNKNTSIISKDNLFATVTDFNNTSDTSTSLIDSILEKAIIDLFNSGLTSDNFEKYQNSFSEGRNFNSNDKVLFIHGQSDTFVKPSNSVEAQSKAQEANTKFNYYWQVSGNPHAFIVIGMNKSDYATLIDKYLECISNDIKCSNVNL